MATETDVLPRLPAGIRLRHSQEGELAQFLWAPTESHKGPIAATISSEGDVVQIWRQDADGKISSVTLGTASCIDWSPDGCHVVTGGRRGVERWDLRGSPPVSLSLQVPSSLCLSPDGQTLALARMDGTIQLQNTATGQKLWHLQRSSRTLQRLRWSPDGSRLAAAEKTIVHLWQPDSGEHVETLHRPIDEDEDVLGMAWSPDGRLLATASSARAVHIWDGESGRLLHTLEGHRGPVLDVSFSASGALLASLGQGHRMLLWRTATWEQAGVLPLYHESNAVRFHPRLPLCAILYTGTHAQVHVYEFDETLVIGTTDTETVRYANAKVVLCGDSGVGKSGLATVLCGHPFAPTESTHGRRVYPLSRIEVTADDGLRVQREVMLWDLAGQPGYRILHQLQLGQVAVALLVCDAALDREVLSGARYWNAALVLSRRALGQDGDSEEIPLRKLLVAARCDRGGLGLSQARIQTLAQELGLSGYHATSAKEGTGIADLYAAIQAAIPWENLPTVSSTNLFLRIKDFLQAEQRDGRVLSTGDDLYRAFGSRSPTPRILRGEFAAGLGRAAAQGLVRSLSFGDLVLLRPELLDGYAGALLNAVRDMGLGSISEAAICNGDFAVPHDNRLKDRGQERLLLLAMIEDLVRCEIALRERTKDGHVLVFPSELIQDPVGAEAPSGQAPVCFEFCGPVQHIYATLVVRLSHSQMFRRTGLWKDAAQFEHLSGATFWISLEGRSANSGRLSLLSLVGIARSTGDVMHFVGHTRVGLRDTVRSSNYAATSLLEHFVSSHLFERALPNSVRRIQQVHCSTCGYLVEERLLSRWLERGHSQRDCPNCEQPIFLILPDTEPLGAKTAAQLNEMEQAVAICRDANLDDLKRAASRTLGQPVRLFCAYAEPDRGLHQQLQTHLSMLKRQGLVETADLGCLLPGSRHDAGLHALMDAANIVLLLLSADFIASDIYDESVQRALSRHEQNQARVIPVIVRPVDWQQGPLGQLSPLPEGGRPVSRWEDRDEAWMDVTAGIRRAIESLRTFH